VFQKVKIAPSILSADFNNLGNALQDIKQAGADWAHVDVMDGHFVPNLTLGVPFVASASKRGVLPLDVHLMIDNPLVELPWFLAYKPHMVSVHIEALQNAAEAQKAAQLIHDAGSLASIAVNPETPIEQIYPTLDCWDMVLVMSVHPGFSGQSYIDGSDKKVAALVKHINSVRCEQRASSQTQTNKAAFLVRTPSTPLIEVDGGMNTETEALVCTAGADVIVSGSTIFKANNMTQVISDLRQIGNQSHAD